MITALILVESGFQDEELIYPYYRMQEEGWTVHVASPDGKERFGKYGVPAKVSSPLMINPVYDVLFIPGGFECPDRLRISTVVQDIVRAYHNEHKLIAAICHGPWVLISAGICKGRTMTGYQSIRPDLENAGAVYKDAAVVVDGNLVTAQHYKHNGVFMFEVMKLSRILNMRVEWPKHEISHV